MSLLSFDQKAELIGRYSEPNRKYHNLAHITTLFELATTHSLALSKAQQLAIWYHDSIYDIVNYSSNELASSQLLLKHFQGHHSYECRTAAYKAKDIILSTRHHESDDNETQVVLDLDLAGLGFEWDYYSKSADLIRDEFSCMSEEAFLSGRRLFIQKMLKRVFIFYTAWGRLHYEDQARANMEQELKKIENKLDYLL
jgi:predicted metal-dependent HD superfamily phosphohydrolase